ncbi:MAG: chitobiase/beta-hexosaminidase C-terminal domain-containing protein [Prevotella sp.]|nr:chitobiase/beta-hexosaminidase C-terminal domain-containing protein [Prevotella sp.]
MKKLFTFALALLGFSSVTSAATVDDIAPLKHSYVLVCDELGARPGKGVLFGAEHFLDVTGGSTATNKGQVDLSVVDALGEEGAPLYVTQEIVDKYGADYPGPHYNWLRLKNAQDVIAMKLTAKSKVIMFIQGNNKVGKDARIPKIATDAELKNALNAAPDSIHPATVSGFRWEYTVEDDGLYYFGSYNGDMFVSFIIVEANEAPGTPTVKLGDQTYEGGLWFREVTAKANDMVEEGSTEKIPTVLTYTTDGTAPTASSPKYTGPIKCYQDMTVKFQAFMDLFGTGEFTQDDFCDGADNEANVTFSFDAPSIEADGANVTIVSPYEGAKNFVSINGGDFDESSSITLEESATVVAKSEIKNGDYTTFVSKTATKDVYVLNPIKEKKVIKVINGNAVLDEEATASSTTGEVYKVEGGEISADKKDFFVKNIEYAVVKNSDYQIDGMEIYIKMNNTNITFQVAEGDSVNVKVTCSKNACKKIDADDNAEDPTALVNDRKCMVNVSGTNYFHKDAEGNEASDLKLCEDANIIEFGLTAGTYTFQKYSGTGNILIYSIEIEPATADPEGIAIVKTAATANAARYNVAGQKVAEGYKGLVIVNGQKLIQK